MTVVEDQKLLPNQNLKPLNGAKEAVIKIMSNLYWKNILKKAEKKKLEIYRKNYERFHLRKKK